MTTALIGGFCIAVGILLGENGDLPDRYSAQFHQVAHRGVGFLGVACPIVEYIAIRRIMAEHIGAGESTEKQQLPLERIWDSDHRGGCSNVSNNTEYLVLLVELLHGVGGARRLITVIGRDQLEHAAFHAAGLVDPVESSIDAELHLASKLLGRAGKRCRDSEPDFLIGYAEDRGAAAADDRCGWRRSGGGRRWCDSGHTWPRPGDRSLEIS